MNEPDEAEPIAPPADWAAQLLHFWFDAHGQADWFKGGTAFDADVAQRFADWRGALRRQPLDAFLTDAETALAAIILFDQVPRNAHRGTAEAFATDHIALGLAQRVIRLGWDSAMEKFRRLFIYLPFEHSEDADDQRDAVAFISALEDEELTRFALAHQAVITRFGRFPHRNAALGRADRAGEAEAVAAGAAF